MDDDKPKTKISRDNIDEIYKKVNELIDTYFTWKIRPSSLKNYLKPGSLGLKKFIQINELDSYENIDKVINDVVDDRFSLESDGVRKFENFDFKVDPELEQTDIDKVLYTNVSASDIKYEKVLADLYRTSLDHIVEDSTKKHIYNATTINEAHLVIIFSKEDINKIKDNLIDYSFDYLNKIDVKMDSLFLKFNLKNKIDEKKFKDSLIEETKTMKIEDWISKVLSNDEYQFKTEYKGYFIWEK